MQQIDVEKINSLIGSVELLVSLIKQEINSNKEPELVEENIVNDSMEYITPYSDDYDEVFLG